MELRGFGVELRGCVELSGFWCGTEGFWGAEKVWSLCGTEGYSIIF